MTDTPVREALAAYFMQAKGKSDKPDGGVAARFVILKQRLLLRCLNETLESEIHALIMRAGR